MEVSPASLNSALASLAVAASQQAIRNYLSQTITLVSNDEVYLDGTGKPWIRLPERPVVAVTTVTDTGATITNYRLRRSLLILTDPGVVWTPGNVNIYVKYTHGYQTAALDSDQSDSDFDINHVPADLSLIALILAKRVYERGPAASQGELQSETIGSYSYTRAASFAASDITDAEKLTLEPYRINGAG